MALDATNPTVFPHGIKAVVVDEDGNPVSITPQAAISDLTDNSAGTPDDTLVAMPDPADTPASADALRDDLVANALPAIRDNIASLNAQIAAINAALLAAGVTA